MKVLIWGSGSKARLVLKMLSDEYGNSISVGGIFDFSARALQFESTIPLMASRDDLRKLVKTCTHFVVCIGNHHGYARHCVSKRLIQNGLAPLDLVSRHAIFDDVDCRGAGVQAMPGAVVHKFCRIGEQCIFNTNSTVDHECVIGDGVHIMGGASVAGRVRVGDYSSIGTNATILPDVTIGVGVIVGAGALVNRNVSDYSVVWGVPAHAHRKNELLVDLSMFD